MAGERMILDLADIEALSVAAREVPFPAGVLHNWFTAAPPRMDIRWRYLRGDRRLRRAVPVRPFDTPAVPLDRGDAEVIEGRMLPMSGIFWLLEEDQFRLDALRASSSDIAGSDEVLDVFANDTISGAQRILQRVMLLQGVAGSTGRLGIGSQSTPENRLQLPPIDYAVPTGNMFTAGTFWNAATPGVLGQMTGHKTLYRTNNGGQVDPGVAVISTRILNALLLDPELRGLYANLIGGSPSAVSEEQVQTVLTNRRLPRLLVDDTQVPDHTGAMRRQIPDNLVVYLPALGTPIGSTQWGQTQEGRKLAQARAIPLNNSAGLIAVPMQVENPVQDGLLVTGIGMPVISQPDLVMAVKVLPDAA